MDDQWAVMWFEPCWLTNRVSAAAAAAAAAAVVAAAVELKTRHKPDAAPAPALDTFMIHCGRQERSLKNFAALCTVIHIPMWTVVR